VRLDVFTLFPDAFSWFLEQVHVVRARELGAEFRLFNYVGDAQNTFPVWNATPLVALDVYEHAYFLDYQTDRASYIDAFFDNLDQTHTTTLLVGLGVLAILLVLPRITSRVPAVLVAIVAATAGSAMLCKQRLHRANVNSRKLGISVSLPATQSMCLESIQPG